MVLPVGWIGVASFDHGASGVDILQRHARRSARTLETAKRSPAQMQDPTPVEYAVRQGVMPLTRHSAASPRKTELAMRGHRNILIYYAGSEEAGAALRRAG